VFLSERKAPLSVDGAQKLIERLGEAAELPFPIHTHMLRHAAAGDGPRGVPGARCVTVALVHLSAFFAHRPIMLPTRTIMAPTNACH
jgi:integrase